mgnify:CR=1 FL=1|jgi:hypothetical protein
MTQPPPERETISRRQHYYDLTIVYCMLLIVLAQVPWPTDTLRRVGIDMTGVVLFLLAGLSFLQVSRARKREKGGTP